MSSSQDTHPAQPRVAVPGSHRDPAPDARAVGAPAPDETIRVTVLLRPRPGGPPLPSADDISLRPPQERPYLTRQEYAARYGAAPADVSAVKAFAAAHGLAVVEVSRARRSVVLSGTAAAVEAAFGVELQLFETPRGAYRGRTGTITVPDSLGPIVQGVFGLDDRAQARSQRVVLPRAAAGTSYTPVQVATLYDFPAGSDGRGQTIAFVELGGGYRTSDLKAYFTGLGLAAPKVISVSVDGGKNAPSGDPNSADGEVLLDIEVAGAAAPGASLVVYFAPNTDQGFLDAITKAIHDTRRKPSVVSISWGGPESSYTAQALQAFDQAIQAAALLGVTVCCASGDAGSSDGATDGRAHVDFPASSPNALACGGTRLEASGGTITRETVWNDGASGGAGGGGISDVFPLPSYQATAGVPPSANPGARVGRGVPDVAGDADPQTGYLTRVDGQQVVVGGTSAVAPLWAGLIARLNQQIGAPVGFLNPLLYGKAAPAGALHDVTVGSNGAYKAGPGWDACTGLGTPDGAKLLAALRTRAASG